MGFYRAFHGFGMALLAVAALSACSQETRPDWMNSMMGVTPRPYANVASGVKRAPALNPKTSGGPPGVPGAPTALQTNPYDYFDAMGNPPPDMAGHAPVPEKPANSGGVNPRKSFPVNLPYEESMQKPAAPENMAYPDLSSVPYVSPEMREIRAGRAKQMQALERERLEAEQKKQVLEQAVAPEPAPAPAAPMPWQAPPSAAAQPPVLLGHAKEEPEAPPSSYADRLRQLQGTAAATPAEY